MEKRWREGGRDGREKEGEIGEEGAGDWSRFRARFCSPNRCLSLDDLLSYISIGA